jgi:hypothetical protein
MTAREGRVWEIHHGQVSCQESRKKTWGEEDGGTSSLVGLTNDQPNRIAGFNPRREVREVREVREGGRDHLPASQLDVALPRKTVQ